MNELLRDAADRAIRYIDGLDSRSVAPSQEAVERLVELDVPLPKVQTKPADTLALLDEVGSPATMASSSGRFFGFVVGGTLPVSLAANWLAGAWDQNCPFFTHSPVEASLEEIALRWLLEALALPPSCAGAFVTGGTMANFTALAAARHALLERVGWDVDADGLFGAPPITVMIGAEAHPTLRKALGLLGLGRDRVAVVPADSQGRMRADNLPSISGPTLVCIQAGNVNTGAFDPAAEICAAAKPAGAWVHVDGAFGLWAAAAPERAKLLAGVADADSWATDAHKWLNVPYDSGIAIVREAEPLRSAMAISAPYLSYSGRREPSEYTPELSRRARGVEVWAALRSLGRSGLRALIERCCQHAADFADRLRDEGYEILNEVVLNQVLVSFGDDDVTDRVIRGVQEDGACWCGGTVWQGRKAMRISVCSWATTDEDVQRSLESMIRAAKNVGAAAS